jgi:endoglucanase
MMNVLTRGRRPALAGLLLASLSTPLAAFAPLPAPSRLVVAGSRLYVDPASPARRQVDAWRRSRPADAQSMERIAAQPMAVWMGEWNRDVRGDVARLVEAAARSGTVPVLVAYNIPGRDCGQHSAGGARDEAAYGRWIRAFAEGIGGRSAIVVLEPDAIALSRCLSPAQLASRMQMLRGAVRELESRGAAVYIDAGHSQWIPAGEMAGLLSRAGIDEAHGFALNVSNFQPTADNVRYGDALSRLVGGKHYVVDTSRNGAGAAGGEWCNPTGRSVGETPTTRTGQSRVDAYLWVKRPGESDGRCNGGPAAGQWWPEYALALTR